MNARIKDIIKAYFEIMTSSDMSFSWESDETIEEIIIMSNAFINQDINGIMDYIEILTNECFIADNVETIKEINELIKMILELVKGDKKCYSRKKAIT